MAVDLNLVNDNLRARGAKYRLADVGGRLAAYRGRAVVPVRLDLDGVTINDTWHRRIYPGVAEGTFERRLADRLFSVLG